MNGFEVADAIYCKIFPVVVLLCAGAGVLSYYVQAPDQSLACFLSMGIGIRLDELIERRRFERAERLAGEGWERLRAPLLSD